MTNRNDIETVIRIRSKDEASADLNRVGKAAGGSQRALGGLSRAFTAVGLGSIGAGVALKMVTDLASQSARREVELEVALRRLGPAVTDSYHALEPFFKDLGNDVNATKEDVETTFKEIVRASGGIAPSLEQVAGAFDLAAGHGTDVSTAAKAVGEALAGNIEPLRALVDPSGRTSFAGLAAELEHVKGAAADAVTPLDVLKTDMREVGEDIGFATNKLMEFFDVAEMDRTEVIGRLNAIGAAIYLIRDASHLAKDAMDALFADNELPPPPPTSLSGEAPMFAGGTPDLSGAGGSAPAGPSMPGTGSDTYRSDLEGMNAQPGFGFDVPTPDMFAGGSPDADPWAAVAGSQPDMFAGGSPDTDPFAVTKPTLFAGGSPDAEAGMQAGKKRSSFQSGFAAFMSGGAEFAEGGIVTGPMRGLVGEAGPEAIIPLGSGPHSRGGMGGTTNLIVQGNLVVDDESRARQLLRSTHRNLQQAGRATGRGLV
tara:strand:+ start:1576 stop:3027 length:1452 start_codon:yes stop_codon:yes gene_type:complete